MRGYREDLKGQVFGRLTVVELVGYKYKNPETGYMGDRHWRCRCSCGNERDVSAGKLKNGHTKSCGCLQKEITTERNFSMKGKMKHALPPGVSAMNFAVKQYRYNAKHRGLVWDLTHDQCYILFKEPCYYCGQTPNRMQPTGDGRSHAVIGGIDRIDNSMGYTVENVAPCCKTCNRAKNDLSHDEFLDWAKRLSTKLGYSTSV